MSFKADAAVFVPGSFSLNQTAVTAPPAKEEPPTPASPPPAESWEDEAVSIADMATDGVGDGVKAETEAATPETTETSTTAPDTETGKDEEKEMEEEEEKDANDGSPEETKKERKKRMQEEANALAEAQDDQREHLNIVFIGHVDAGKSTISGQVLYLTGMVDQRTIEKFQREADEKNRGSWFLAYIMDSNEEERAKGKTIEVGRAHFATSEKRYTILDAPGHKNYVPNMIAGVAQADIGILVISARKGEFEAGFQRSGQTREHAILAKTLGVQVLVVVINKMDESTVMWRKERYDKIQTKLTPFLKSIGYHKKDIYWIPISGYTGENIIQKVDEKTCPWYSGDSLISTLNSLDPLARMDEKPLRIPVLDKFKEAGKMQIMGKIETGVLRVGDELLCAPDMRIKTYCCPQEIFSVLQLQNDIDVISVARPGENVTIGVKGSGVDDDRITTGSVLCHPDTPPPVSDQFVAQIVILDLLETKSLFTAGYECVCHLHTATEEVTVTRLLEQLDPKTGKRLKLLPKFVQSKSVVIAHFTLAKPLAFEKYGDFHQLGRFSLRDEGTTIAFGKVLATEAPTRRRKK